MDILHSAKNIVITALPLWVTALNPATFLLFGLDKLFAKRNKRRIRERTLFLLTFLGGSVGALTGMILWNHKTRHNLFRVGIPAVMLVQTLAALYLLTTA